MTDTMTVEEYREMVAEKPKKGRINATKVTVDGFKCDSQAEADHYLLTLKPLLEQGKIKNLRHHDSYEIIPAFRDHTGKWHRARVIEDDWNYDWVDTGEHVIEDVKGMVTDVYSLKLALFRYIYRETAAKQYVIVPAKQYTTKRSKRRSKL